MVLRGTPSSRSRSRLSARSKPAQDGLVSFRPRCRPLGGRLEVGGALHGESGAVEHVGVYRVMQCPPFPVVGV
jgi:hypothetical protein